MKLPVPYVFFALPTSKHAWPNVAACWRSTALPGRTDGGRVLEDVDLEAALGVCAQDPGAAGLATTRIEAAARLGLRLCGGQLWGFQRDGVLVAVCWAGANLVPVIPDGGEDAI